MTAPNYVSPERFAVSHIGMRELHANRHPWQLVKELIQNAFDEAPQATVCEVTVEPSTKETTTKITVKDDGPGFQDIADAWTLLKHTAKRMEPTKRGRFNMGEKEIISVAVEATVDTVGHTVSFPRMGSRIVSTNTRKKGTNITVIMPWDQDQAEELVENLRRFRPTDCRLVVNDLEVPQREPLMVREATLTTFLQDGPGQPSRHTRRKTEIHLLPPADFTNSWLYEMGIPIQPIDTPWDIDIQQKVPMPPNRDTVGDAYLTDIYAESLNATHDQLEEDQFSAPWVKQAIEDTRIDPETIVSTIKGRYGNKVIIMSPDQDANMKASESGYNLINPRSLSKTERDRFRQDGGLKTTHQSFGRDYVKTRDIIPQADSYESKFRLWATKMATFAGLKVQVSFFKNYNTDVVADCSANTTCPDLRFNTANPPQKDLDFFKPPYGRAEQLELLIHELGHAYADKPMEHGPSWGEGVAKVAGGIAAALKRENPLD